MPYCLEDIERIYRRLDVHFDHTLGESYYHDMLPGVVEELRRRGIARESQGAVCVFLEGQPAPMIVQKQDGAYLYATTDLATIRYRMEQWRPDAILYVVDHRQSHALPAAFRPCPPAGLRQGRVPARQLRHRAGQGRPALQDPRRRHGRSGGPVGRGDPPRRPDRGRERRRQARRRRAFARAAGLRGRDGRHWGPEICRSLAESHQRLRVRLRKDAGHERQHGDLHAICLRPGAEHLCQGRYRHRAASRVRRGRSRSARRPNGHWAWNCCASAMPCRWP